MAHPFLRRLLDYFSEHGEVRSAAEYGEAPATHRPHAPPPAAAAEREAAERARAREVALEKKLRARLVAFAEEGGAAELLLPRSLSSFERMLAHRLAAELGLGHASVGEGDARQLRISKPSTSQAAASATEAAWRLR